MIEVPFLTIKLANYIPWKVLSKIRSSKLENTSALSSQVKDGKMEIGICFSGSIFIVVKMIETGCLLLNCFAEQMNQFIILSEV